MDPDFAQAFRLSPRMLRAIASEGAQSPRQFSGTFDCSQHCLAAEKIAATPIHDKLYSYYVLYQRSCLIF